MNLAKFRRKYSDDQIVGRHKLKTNPFEFFSEWLQDAENAGLDYLTHFALATVNKNIPSARMVSLKHFDKKGLVFYTNYESNKARDISTNPNVAAVFYWPELKRQIRISGLVRKISKQESEKYFQTRSYESKIAASISPQSKTITDLESLLKATEKAKKEFSQKKLKCPPCWGGYRITPISFEFWQAGANRLHDRLFYKKSAAGKWSMERLAP